MRESFAKIIVPVLEIETGFDLETGGDHVDPKDKGKRTRWGIAQASWPNVNLDEMDTVQKASAFFLEHYWAAYPFLDALPWPYDAVTFDDVVNSGPGDAAQILQKYAGIPFTGFVGPVTIARIAALATVPHSREHYFAARGDHYRTFAQADRYDEGWLFRLFHIHAAVVLAG